MAERTLTERIGATPGKIAIAVVLLGVFVSLLIMQTGDEPLDAANAPNRYRGRTTPLAAPSNTPSGETADAMVSRRPWPEISLAEARKYDPFFMPAVDATANQKSRESQLTDAMKQKAMQEQAELRRQALDTLQEKGVGVVLQSGDELVAIIGSDTVRIGDVIDGFKVVDIGPDGVKLEPDDLK